MTCVQTTGHRLGKATKDFTERHTEQTLWCPADELTTPEKRRYTDTTWVDGYRYTRKLYGNYVLGNDLSFHVVHIKGVI